MSLNSWRGGTANQSCNPAALVIDAICEAVFEPRIRRITCDATSLEKFQRYADRMIVSRLACMPRSIARRLVSISSYSGIADQSNEIGYNVISFDAYLLKQTVRSVVSNMTSYSLSPFAGKKSIPPNRDLS